MTYYSRHYTKIIKVQRARQTKHVRAANKMLKCEMPVPKTAGDVKAIIKKLFFTIKKLCNELTRIRIL